MPGPHAPIQLVDIERPALEQPPSTSWLRALGVLALWLLAIAAVAVLPPVVAWLLIDLRLFHP